MIVDFENQDIIIEIAPEGQDGKSIRPLGEWSDTVDYQALDLVTYQGNSYIALKDVPAGTLPTDAEYWMINASNQTTYWGTISGTLSSQTDLQNALDGKADADTVYTKTETDNILATKADADTVYTKTETDDLLDLKANAADVYTQTELDGIFDGIDNALSTKADASSVYTKAETNTLLSAKADANNVYTKAEADSLLAEKADADDVYTKTETDNLLSAKANTADLGALADQDTVDYETEVTNKPTLGTMSAEDADDYYTKTETDNLLSAKANSADLGTMAEESASDYYNKTETDALLFEKADIIHSTASGSLVHLTDAGAYPVDSLSVAVEPVQDLHGQSAPYPAGGGKNLLPLSLTNMKTINTAGTWAGNVYSYNGVTYTVNSDSGGNIVSVSATGTATGYSLFRLYNDITFTSETILNGCPSGGSYSGYRLQADGGTARQDIGSGVTIPANESKTRVIVAVAEGVNPSGAVFKPMIRLASVTDATFAPYSNICLISGHATATVTRTGINIWDEITEIGAISQTDGSDISATTKLRTPNYISVKPNITYYFKSPNGADFFCYDSNKTYLGKVAIGSGNQTVTIPSNTFYVRFSLYSGYGTTYNNDISINYPSSDHDYHAYSGTSVIIDLDGERYGGTVDALTGVMTVDRVFLETTWGSTQGTVYANTEQKYKYFTNISNVIGSGNNASIICNTLPYAFNNYDIPHFYASGYESAYTRQSLTIFMPIGTSADTVLQFCAKTKEPIATVQLTPTQLSLLFGTNNVWADTGDCAVGYRADTKLYIERLTKPSEDDMTANVNIASGKFFMVGNNLYYSTASIASGEAIVVGTNCTALSLADALNNLA